jgi:hypothetical protein
VKVPTLAIAAVHRKRVRNRRMMVVKQPHQHSLLAQVVKAAQRTALVNRLGDDTTDWSKSPIQKILIPVT